MIKMITDILEEDGYEVFSAQNGREGLVKVNIEKPDLVLLDVVMPEMDGFEVCKVLREDESNSLLPIIMLTAQNDDDHKLKGLELGADDYIVKPFNPRELLSRVKNTLVRIDRNRWANPLTGLKGNNEIQFELNHRIANNLPIGVLYLDIDNFKAYNDVYGFARGDTAIKLTSDVITDNVSLYGNRDDFVGHIGGDDFLVISTPEKVEDISRGVIKDFDQKVLTIYNSTDRQQGYITTADRIGNVINYPIMSISIAVVTNEDRKFQSVVEVTEIAAEVKKKAKSIAGSIFLKNRRNK